MNIEESERRSVEAYDQPLLLLLVHLVSTIFFLCFNCKKRCQRFEWKHGNIISRRDTQQQQQPARAITRRMLQVVCEKWVTIVLTSFMLQRGCTRNRREHERRIGSTIGRNQKRKKLPKKWKTFLRQANVWFEHEGDMSSSRNAQ